jgi:hypothetical protein
MPARHHTGGIVRLCKPAFDLELPLTVVTEAYAATDERRAIKVNLRSHGQVWRAHSRRDQCARVLTDSGVE